MKKSTEDYYINMAKTILERRKDESARRFAVDNELKLDMQRVIVYGAYYSGAMAMARHLEALLYEDDGTSSITLKQRPYIKAILDKIGTSKRNAELFLDGYDIHYRNHKKSKSGKVVSCEVFFTKQKTIDVEIV